MDKPLRQPFKSKAKNKKYSVYVKINGKRRLIHFGDRRYGHYHDKIGDYKHLDTFDKEMRKRYYSRHGEATDRNTPKWFSHKYLW